MLFRICFRCKRFYSRMYSTLLLSILFACAASELSDEGEKENTDEEANYEEVTETEGGEIFTEDSGEVRVVLEEDKTTEPPDRSNEEWVSLAVLDVGYYLRNHKFNDFDRRYYTEFGVEESLQYGHFPTPPLRSFHWEVHSYCSKGFYDCLEYLQKVVLEARLTRSIDTNELMNERQWEYPRNGQDIEVVQRDCKRLKDVDWMEADPFKGPLERFKWRVTASYYMCSFTALELPPLKTFDRRCDNFAACLEGRQSFNSDPRANNSVPYQCARYSFCPEVCCPKKIIEHFSECLQSPGNPCHGLSEFAEGRECYMKRERNLELMGMALNMWNSTCPCPPGFEWESMFGACVDIDECATGSHGCEPTKQTCLNLKGRYACVCAWGFLNATGSCVPNSVLTNALSRLHRHHHPPDLNNKKTISLYKLAYNWAVMRLFFSTTTTPEPVNVTIETYDTVDFDSE